MSEEIVRVYVGVDTSQILAVPVLEHSIKRHTDMKVEVIPMLDLPVPEPKDPRQGQRTGFSYSRFCIPKLAGYKGKAIYMDADMLVFSDIKELWNIPFDGAKVIIQEEVKQTTNKEGAPDQRIKQCSVMLIDCDRVDWDIETIVQGFDDELYDYEDLMYRLCILDESDIKYGVPFTWNSLEHYDAATNLIHYTDVYTQPWTSHKNQNAEVWFDEVRLMLKNGALTWEQIQKEIDKGYFRPSLLRDIKYGKYIPKFFQPMFQSFNAAMDKASPFVAHADVYAAKRKRKKAIKEFELKLAEASK